jgi:nucleotide-binding universal stress UspA family protein
MYDMILVPLDGSELAETALAHALGLARLNQAQVTLLQVVPPIEYVLAAETEYPIFIDQQWDSQKRLAMEYLQGVCKRMRCNDIKICQAVEMGPAAEMIIDYAHEHSVDLIAMATHGRSGLQRWVYGSVADKVLRGVDLPVLLIRAHEKQKAASAYARNQTATIAGVPVTSQIHTDESHRRDGPRTHSN